MDNKEIINTCIERWDGLSVQDTRLENFSNEFQSWFLQIPTISQPIVIALLNNFEYYSRRTVNSWLEKLHNQLIEAESVTDENTIYAFIKSKDGISNSSNDYWTEYKSINKLNLNICYENMNVINDEQWEYINNVVFIDDCSGSGNSFLDELKKHPKRYQNKNVYFVAINIMKTAAEQIDLFAKENQTNIFLLKATIQEKAFDREIFTDGDIAKKNIINMSRDFEIPEHEILGFNKSESLMAFYNNTPNNTLGFFRYDTKTYKSIFPRRNDKKPKWQMLKKDKNTRKISNYNNIKRSNGSV